jgi:hypothetical protein
LRGGVNNPVWYAIMEAVSFLGDGWVPVILVLSVTTVFALKKKYV